MPISYRTPVADRIKRVVARIEQRRELARHSDIDGSEDAEAAFTIALSLIREEFRDV